MMKYANPAVILDICKQKLAARKIDDYAMDISTCISNQI